MGVFACLGGHWGWRIGVGKKSSRSAWEMSLYSSSLSHTTERLIFERMTFSFDWYFIDSSAVAVAAVFAGPKPSPTAPRFPLPAYSHKSRILYVSVGSNTYCIPQTADSPIRLINRGLTSDGRGGGGSCKTQFRFPGGLFGKTLLDFVKIQVRSHDFQLVSQFPARFHTPLSSWNFNSWMPFLPGF